MFRKTRSFLNNRPLATGQRTTGHTVLHHRSFGRSVSRPYHRDWIVNTRRASSANLLHNCSNTETFQRIPVSIMQVIRGVRRPARIKYSAESKIIQISALLNLSNVCSTTMARFIHIHGQFTPWPITFMIHTPGQSHSWWIHTSSTLDVVLLMYGCCGIFI